MAEVPNQIPAPLPTAEEVAAANAKVAAQLAAQDISGQSMAGKPGDFEEAGTALDKLIAAQPDPAKVEAEAKAKADAEAATKAAAEATAKAEADAKAKAAAEAAAKTTTEPATTPPADPFKDVPPLPQGTSAKAAESWEAVKARAVQEITARETQIAELRKQVAEMAERAKNPTTEQLQATKELEELKLWRAKMDVEFDPQFKVYDKQAQEARDFIYAQLKESPVVSDEIIEKIKAFGGPEKTDLSKVFEAAKDPALQRIVEAKIADLKMIQFQKNKALTATKENVGQWMKEREQAFSKASTAHTEATQAEANRLLGSLDWMKDKAVTGAETDPARIEAEAHNKLLTEIKSELADALRDDSPQMRAILLTSYAQMRNYKAQVTAQEAQIKALTTERDAAVGKLSKIKESATSRLRETGAPPGGQALPAKPVDVFNKTAAQSLDDIAKQVTEARAAKGV